jgi:hypothetical protein
MVYELSSAPSPSKNRHRSIKARKSEHQSKEERDGEGLRDPSIVEFSVEGMAALDHALDVYISRYFIV